VIQRNQEFVATTIGEHQRVVTFGGVALNPRWDLRNHSPDGFNWGYGGSGPAQLALAIVAAVLGDDALALELYQSYKHHLIAGISVDNWRLPASEVLAWCEDQPAYRERANRN
jgi:hypothetical protein